MAVGPVKLIAPVVLIVELCVMVAPVAVNEARGVVPPIAPVSVTVPLVPPLRVKAPAPLTVLDSVMFVPAELPPALVVSRLAEPLNVVAPKLIVPRVVCKMEAPELKVVAPKAIAAPLVVVLTVPNTVVAPAVLVKPFVKARLGEAPLKSVTPPVLEKVVAGVMVPPLLKTTP
jgi:hypothetical protein